jgi:hypothetical protein
MELYVIILITLAVGYTLGHFRYKKKVTRDLKELDYYKKKYLWKQGGTQEYSSYNLRSFDGGLTWYAVDVDSKTKALTIKGQAEEVFPGLMAHLDGWDRLFDYVSKKGPITFSGNRAADDLKVLENAGFEVTTK